MTPQQPVGPLSRHGASAEDDGQRRADLGIRLDVSIETPLSHEDRDILAGIGVMVLAIANRQNLADQPHMREDELEGMEPAPCGSPSKDEPDRYCIREVGHKGRHEYRPLNGLANEARKRAGLPSSTIGLRAADP